jgi:7-keto-8-aminopelargonate synthetase-like enzyme
MVDTANRHVGEAEEAGVIMNRGGQYGGSFVEVDGRQLRNFGGCSYLALEVEPSIQDAACAATRRFGTQFPFSRAYLENALYAELEDALREMTGGHIVVAPSTSLAHLAALPVLVRDGDAVLVDQFAHASLQTAVRLLRDTPTELIRHNRLDLLEDRLAALESTHRRVWYVCDGIYSMRGDCAPFDALRALLNRHPALHLYIDDAHATTWCGANGRGAALTRIGLHDRVVVALSLNKAFSAAGGALVLPDARLVTLIRRCGGPMLFSGPIQPPMLGAAVASARLHLQPRFADLQGEVRARIDRAAAALDGTSIQLASAERTPIFMVHCDSAGIVFRAVTALRDLGFYVCPTVFPAVPVNQPGIRFTITRHNSDRDIDQFIAALAFALDMSCGASDVGQRRSEPIA